MFKIFDYGFILTFTGLCMLFIYNLVNAYSGAEISSDLADSISFIPRLFLILGLILIVVSILIWVKKWAKMKAKKCLNHYSTFAD